MTTKLAHSCFQLYQFWESVRGAPSEVNIIKNDLQILTKILEEIGDDKDLSPSVRLALLSCEAKLNVNPTPQIGNLYQAESPILTEASGKQRSFYV